MVKREEYLSRLRLWRGKDVIKVITGVRRCGNSISSPTAPKA